MNIKERTIGILGQKGTGKTFLTRKIISNLDNGVILFDTIGAVKVSNVRVYEIEARDFEKQAVLFSAIVRNTQKNIGINFKGLTKNEIIEFTDIFLKITPIKKRYFFIDEIADYVPQQGKKSYELERLVRHGRNDGVTFIFNTQRPAYLSKNVLNLVDVAIFFRLVWTRDILVVKDILNNLGKKDIDSEISVISNQKVGEARTYIFA